MALSWNEIKSRAIAFSNEWKDESNENAEAKSFWDGFFDVFGINRRRLASFEHAVKKLGNKQGFIDLFWPGNLIIEHKSKGKNLNRAFAQAFDYFEGLKEHELPKFILVSDFQSFRLYDLEDDTKIEFELKDLVNHVQEFGFIAGYQKRIFKEEDPVNIQAAELMGKLHDKLKEIGYTGHSLELYLVRLLFMLFADDTTIFEKGIFQDFIELKTSEDGSDLASRLSELFYLLNTPRENRFKNIDEHLNQFPYVNGKLFEEVLPPASFDSEMRNLLLQACYLNWGKISPAIFGSMFQSVMNPTERRNLGAHYTSEKNIFKVIKPLFLDELWEEFHEVKGNRNKLMEFHRKLSNLKFLDPACGCGNFLVITYRELRLLELEILRVLIPKDQQITDIDQHIWLNVDMMYGIEIEEFPSRISEVAMWLIDHQMNMLMSHEFGQYFLRLPLRKSANIIHGNALKLDWRELISTNPIYIDADSTTMILNEPNVEYSVNVRTNNLTIIDKRISNNPINPRDVQFDYIFGNPPFIGSKMMTANQRLEIKTLFDNSSGSGVLDYVTGWYLKASDYIKNTKTKVAFVSTNSITQGEQVSILWSKLYKDRNKIHFAHRTFKWSNEAKGNAAVYCVIIGFANFDSNEKFLFEYEDVKGEPHSTKVKNINPYLVDAKDILISKQSNPICDVPKMSFGNIALDSGFLIFSEEEKHEFISKEPKSEKWFRLLLGANELLYNKKRYCLWLVGIQPSELKAMPLVMERANKVKEARLNAKDKGTQKLATRSYQFRDLNNPDKYIAIPITTGEVRDYIPLVFADETLIPAVTVQSLPDANMFHFGVLHSKMHMAWVKYVAGRLKSDFRYSKDIVYNNYPWPEAPTEKQTKAIEDAAQKVLDARALFPESTLATLYDPIAMPLELVKAHNALDKAVDLAYRPQPFTSDANRMEYLFELYEKYTAGLFKTEKKKRKKQQK